MRTTRSPYNISGYIGILAWFYCVAFLQLYKPFTISVTITCLIFYCLIYIGLLKKLFPKKFSSFVAVIAFTISFTLFWIDVIHLIFFLNGLTSDKDMLIMSYNIALYAILFIIFYTRVDKLSPQLLIFDQSVKRMAFFLEITFPLIIATSFFLGTFSLYGLIPRARSEVAGVDTLIATVSLSIAFTVLLTSLFEGWLSTANRRTVAKVYIAEVLAGLVLTIIIIRST